MEVPVNTSMNVKQFSQAMIRLRLQIEEAAVVGVREAAEIIKEEAKEWIGEEHETWPPLADVTIRQKEALGYEVPKPLLRTGKLRDSIKVESTGFHAEIGTDNPLGPIQEHGTLTIPPRPFLSSALKSKGNEAVAVIEANIAKALRRIS